MKRIAPARALAASSPVLEGRVGPALDNRLLAYRDNARWIPSVTGRVVPERIRSEAPRCCGTDEAGEQAVAASRTGSHARLLAGPGTGKTHTLVENYLRALLDEHVPAERDLQRAASIGLFVMLAHSAVDYPLRTATLACLFALCAAILEKAGRPTDRELA